MAGSAVRTIRIILTADGKQYVTEMNVAAAATERVQSKMERMQKVGRGMSSVGRSMTMLAAPIIGVGAYAAKSAASFQSSMELIRTQAGQSQAEVNSMSRSVLKMAPELGTSTADLADGLYHIESAGYHGAQALKMLRLASQGAKVGQNDLTSETNAMTAAVVSGIKGVGNYQHAMGMLNATVGAGDMHMQDLADAFGNPAVLSAMHTYGVNLRDTGAALAVFGDNNIRGAEAGTKLVSAIRIMSAPSTAAAKALATIGLGPGKLNQDMRGPGGLLSAMKDLKAHLVDSGETLTQQGQTITAAFGGRQSMGVQLLLNQIPRLKQKVDAVAKGATSFGDAWKATQKNVSFQWDKLKQTLQVAMIHIGKAIMPLLTKYLPPLVHDIAAVAKWFSHLPQPVLKVVAGLTAFLAIGGPILWFLGNLVTMVGTLGKALVFLADNPVVLAFVAIVVAGVLLGTHLKQVGQVASSVFHAMGDAVSSVGHFIGSVFSTLFHVISWPFVQAWNIIKRIADHIVGAFRGVAHTVGQVFHFIGHNPITDAIGLSGSGGLLHGFGLLHAGGVVRERTHFDTGGPVGTDTIPGWLTPGEGVLNRAAMANVGVMGLQRLNAGGSLGGDITITAETPVVLKTSDREIGQASIRWFATRQARGSSSLVGGGQMTGSRTG